MRAALKAAASPTKAPRPAGLKGAARRGQALTIARVGKVKPNLTVAASVSCPNAVDLKVSDTLKTDKAVGRSELEEMISRRTSIATEKGGRFCLYVPQFELTREAERKGHRPALPRARGGREGRNAVNAEGERAILRARALRIAR